MNTKKLTKISLSVATLLASCAFIVSEANKAVPQNTYPIYTELSYDSKYVVLNDLEAVKQSNTDYSAYDDSQVVNAPELSQIKEVPKGIATELEQQPASDVSDKELQSVELVTDESPTLEVPNLINNQKPQTEMHIVGSGDGLISVLKGAGIDSTDIKDIVYNSGTPEHVFNLKNGDVLEFEKKSDGSLKKLVIKPIGDCFHTIERTGERFVYKKSLYPEVKEVINFTINITDSLYLNGEQQGLTAKEISSIVDILKAKVNMNSVQKGEKFDIVLERTFANGRDLNKSSVIAIRHVEGDKVVYGFRWQEGDDVGYFDKNGNGLLPSFRRHPIDNPRITSHYNPKRLHPVLKIVRPHRGTDYAGAGKPIMAIADGKIVSAGRRGSFGNAVIVKHAYGVQTLNAHMSRFGKGIKTGVNVKKGQVIGYIGSTGIVTGPHLHFEMKINGKYVNSLKAQLPTGDKVSDLDDYSKYVSKVMLVNRW